MEYQMTKWIKLKQKTTEKEASVDWTSIILQLDVFYFNFSN